MNKTLMLLVLTGTLLNMYHGYVSNLHDPTTMTDAESNSVQNIVGFSGVCPSFYGMFTTLIYQPTWLGEYRFGSSLPATMFIENQYELEVDFDSNDGFIRVQGPHFDDFYCSADRLKIYLPAKTTTMGGFLPQVQIAIDLNGDEGCHGKFQKTQYLVSFYIDDQCTYEPFFNSLQLGNPAAWNNLLIDIDSIFINDPIQSWLEWLQYVHNDDCGWACQQTRFFILDLIPCISTTNYNFLYNLLTQCAPVNPFIPPISFDYYSYTAGTGDCLLSSSSCSDCGCGCGCN